jgi:8-oxo-dGTP diphosphatase
MRQAAQLLLLRPDGVLLALHRAGAFAGRYTGLLAHVDAARGETAAQAAVRAAAAAGVAVPLRALRLVAVFHFREACGAEEEEHEFVCDSAACAGEPAATALLLPRWFALADVPFHAMPADDALWYPRVLAGQRLRGAFAFDAHNRMTRSDVRQVDAL